MALLGKVESKSLRGRTIHGIITLALIIGSLTMVYPFCVMLSGSVRSELDQAELDLIPAFWTDDDVLYQKFLETKYNQDVSVLNRAHRQRYFSFQNPQPPAPAETAAGDRLDADGLERWMDSGDVPAHWQALGGIQGVRTVPEPLRELRQRLSDRFDGDLDVFSRDIGTPVATWQAVGMTAPDWVTRRYDHPPGAMFEVYEQMLAEAPAPRRQLVSLSGHFLQSIIFPTYGQTNTQQYNLEHAEPLEDYADFHLPATVPGTQTPRLRDEWIEYVHEELNSSFVVTEGIDQAQYDAFLTDQLGLDRSWPLPDGRQWLAGAPRDAYTQFIRSLPPENLRLVGPEFTVNQADLPAAIAAMEYRYVLENAGSLRWAYTIRNYINVLDELVFQGRALLNTVIYCVLAIVLSLLVNPMAAYALSRFKMRSTYKVLLFLMATIAFPPMVTLIPQFILLREAGLLNTFIALVLPLIANGYMIFLLMGFFDSLPAELYEAAKIDGASETRMFFQITMSLSKPILAVLALGTFTGAYMSFLYPLLVASDPDMWLISVWLFQYQQRASSAGIYASVVIASIPTLIIFLFAQRTIMRGIVVPTEK